jgi:hypothetical protein
MNFRVFWERRVVKLKLTNVSEVRTASIIRVMLTQINSHLLLIIRRGLSMIVSIFCYTDKYPAPFPKIKEKNFR